MGRHFQHILVRAAPVFLAWNSATPFSIARDFLVAFTVFIIMAWRMLGNGWWRWSVLRSSGKTMLLTLLSTLGGLVVVMGVAFAAAIPFVIDQDHTELVARVKALRLEVNSLHLQLQSASQKNDALAQNVRDLQAKLAPAFIEPVTSLRRRVIALASDAQMFFNEIHENNPPYGNGKADATGDQKRINDEAKRYWAEQESKCMDKFDIRTRGIVQELKAAGVDVGRGPDSPYLEDMVEGRRCIGMEPQIMPKLRKLAWFLDAHGRLVTF